MEEEEAAGINKSLHFTAGKLNSEPPPLPPPPSNTFIFAPGPSNTFIFATPPSKKQDAKPEDCDQIETRGLKLLLLRSGGNIFFLNQTCPENSRTACSRIAKHTFCVAVVMGKEEGG